MSIRVGHILRHEDESGVSGTGIVAEWIEYSDGEVVVHWLSHTPSTNHYRNFKQVDAIHGHGGKTEMVVVWEGPKPDPEEAPSEEGEEGTTEVGDLEEAPEPEPEPEAEEKPGDEKPPAKKKSTRKAAPKKGTKKEKEKE